MSMHQENAAPAVRRSLDSLADRLNGVRSLRDGDVVLRLSGDGGGTYLLACRRGQAKVTETAAVEGGSRPMLEVIGDGEAVRAILDGEADARERWFAGGLRVRGDLRYLSDVAMELGLLKAPL